MPMHYAFSDAAVLAAGAWGAIRLWPHGHRLAALGMAGFSLAAAIGVIRFGSGEVESFAALHTTASQVLGLAGSAALVGCLSIDSTTGRAAGAFAAAVVTATVIHRFAPLLMAPLVVGAITAGVLLGTWRAARRKQQWFVPLGFAILLVDMLLVRRNPMLGADVAWHGYHLLIALGLLLIARGIEGEARSI
ncbi:hypothetical protein [Tsuneonella mangrovi]|uniref:hypothetical protein n=1 Tax=Tsuneonella mangrovi TaxID=1982042 RepID=UPI000BA1D2C9|nr:hypothetical protein [Tsuneonella mangrovi]